MILQFSRHSSLMVLFFSLLFFLPLLRGRGRIYCIIVRKIENFSSFLKVFCFKVFTAPHFFLLARNAVLYFSLFYSNMERKAKMMVQLIIEGAEVAPWSCSACCRAGGTRRSQYRARLLHCICSERQTFPRCAVAGSDTVQHKANDLTLIA